MIDLNTGIIEIEDIVITPNVLLSDFCKYQNDKVDIYNRGNGRGIITLIKKVNSNGIDAEITVEINKNLNTRRVIITPDQGLSGVSMLEFSKRWMRGFAVGSYHEQADSISGNYAWGWFSAQYTPDRDYGMVGGEILIVYRG